MRSAPVLNDLIWMRFVWSIEPNKGSVEWVHDPPLSLEFRCVLQGSRWGSSAKPSVRL